MRLGTQFYGCIRLSFAGGLLGFLISLGAASQAIARSRIEVQIKGVKKSRGVLRAALFSENQAEHFPKDKGFAEQRRVIPARMGENRLIFPDLSPGRYAIAVYQDKNKNGKLDKNFFGMPKEPYGFSVKRESSRRRAATFEEAAFTLRQDQHKKIWIDLD